MAEIHIDIPVRLDVNFGQSFVGLTDVGYTLKNPDDSVYRSRTSLGVVESGDGYYYVDLTFAEEWSGYIEWDSPSVPPPKPRDDIRVVSLLPTFYTSAMAGVRSTIPQFLSLLKSHGSTVTYHQDYSLILCPCRTKQGSRNPEWHLQHPAAPICNEAGMIPQPNMTDEFQLRAFVQPVQAGAVRRLVAEQLLQMFGEIESDDHIGLFPVSWNGKYVNFYDWGQATEDYIIYNGRKFTAVAVNLIPDPGDGNPWHHWEIGLRLIS